MGIHEKPGSEGIDSVMLTQLRTLAQGFDVFGNRVSISVQQQAIDQYHRLVDAKRRTDGDLVRAHGEAKMANNDEHRAKTERVRAMTERMRAETEIERSRLQMNMERERMLSDQRLEQARLQLEAQRAEVESIVLIENVQIEKAKVVVSALEVAAKSGADPEHLLAAIGDLSRALTERPIVPALPGPTVRMNPSRRKELTGPVAVAPEDDDDPNLPAYERIKRRRIRKRRERELGSQEEDAHDGERRPRR